MGATPPAVWPRPSGREPSMAKTTAEPSTLRGAKARRRTAQDLLEELNPMMMDLCGTAAAIGIVTRALDEADSGKEAMLAMATLADALQRDVQRIDRLYTQALEASWDFARETTP